MNTAQKVAVLLSGGGNYASRVLSTGPVALWGLGEGAGATSVVDSAGGFTGTPANVTFGAATFPDGTLAPLFDASNEVITLPVATLDAPFNPAEGSLAVWLRVRQAAVWTDGTTRAAYEIGADVNNRVYFIKSSANNRIDVRYVAGGTSSGLAVLPVSPSTWFHMAITWSVSSDACRVYLNGAQFGGDATGLGTWSGTLANGFTAIGNFTSSGGANFWDGYIKYAGLWDRPLTQNDINTLYVPGYAV